MMKYIDCLLIGHNETIVESYEALVRSLGKKSGSYRDLSLSLVEVDNCLYTAMDVLRQQRLSIPLPHKHVELSPAIAYLGTFLHRANLAFDFVNNFQDEQAELIKKLTENEILTIAITTTLYVVPYPIIEIINFIRKYNKTAKIIVGGPFIVSQNRVLTHQSLHGMYENVSADFYVNSSQGEGALVDIITALKNQTPYVQIPNIIYREQERYIETPLITEDHPLAANMVDWSLFPKAAIGDFVSLRTSISCPFACAFCGFPERAGEYRYIDVDVLENNLNELHNLQTVKVLHFIDDTFNVPKERFQEILRMMIRNKYQFKWNSMYRCQFADRETVELMKESGCQGVFLGIESGSDSILKNMNKKATVDSFKHGMELLHEYGISMYASFIIGFPGETEETVQETVRFIEETRPTFYRTQLWYCDPLTPIWKEREKYNIKGSAFQWSHQTMNSEQACDLIDNIFLSMKNSIWLPQYKFEFQSVYSLLNQGFSVYDVQQFLSYFNTLVGTQIEEHPGYSVVFGSEQNETKNNSFDFS